jgi:hypothetical protein
MTLTETEILDIVHCRMTDPTWAKAKAGHCLVDAEACEKRVREFEESAARVSIPDAKQKLLEVVQTFRDMAQRYRERARLYKGENT